MVSCVLTESEGGVLIFECNQEYTYDPNGSRFFAWKKDNTTHLLHQLSGKDEVFHGLLCKIILYVIVMSSYRSPGVFNGDFDGFGLGQVPGPVGNLVSQELPVDS